MISKKFLTFIFFVIISSLSVNSSYSIEPDIFVQSTVNRASQTLNANLSKLEKIEKLKNIRSFFKVLVIYNFDSS